jgi:predicted nucleotidyltransferase
MNFDVDKNTIFLTRSGSMAYGTNIATSDEDFKGVCIPPKDFVVGPFFNFDQKEELVSKGHKYDRVIFALMKFIKLASECNPNIVELLFTDTADWVVCTDLGLELIEHRDLFVTKKAKWRFMGYAHAQLKRIKGHRAWLLNPPKKKPERTDFGLPEDKKLISNSAMGAIDEAKSQGYTIGSEAETVIQRQKQFATALKQWQQYQNWKKSRNEDRAKLEAKFGYDTKHGMHLLRLMRMCAEILAGDGVKTRRPDAAELVEIRNGSKSYDELLEEAESLEAKCNELFETSTLPEAPDPKKLNDLCVYLHEEFWGGL